MKKELTPLSDLKNARVLAVLGGGTSATNAVLNGKT
jgi:hypothetical protein